MTWSNERYCLASPKQLALACLSLPVLSFGFGAVFAALGQWMVLPSVGLELVVLAVAFN